MNSNQDPCNLASASLVSSLEDRLPDCVGSEDYVAVIRALVATRDPAAIPVLASLLDSVGPIAAEAIAGLLTFGDTAIPAMRMNSLETKTPDSTTGPHPGVATTIDAPVPANDNTVPGGIPDTTALVARPEVVRSIRATLRRYRVAQQDLDDAIAEVQVESIEAARTRAAPCDLAQWRALATTVAVHWALDRLREAKVRRKYDAGLCDDADAYLRPTLRWEHADPVDTKRYLAVLKGLFDAGKMPEHGQEILQGEADGVPHDEIAAEIGVSTTVVHNRLSRMRAKFRARLAALGMLALALLLLCGLLSSGGKVVASAPPPAGENRLPPSEEIAPLPPK